MDTISTIPALATLLRQHGDKILSGTHKFAITATQLQHLNEAFCEVIEQDTYNSVFQVINTTNSKLHDLHFLHDFVQKVESLVISHGSSTLKGNVDISRFRNLRQLEVRRVPLHMVSGLTVLQAQLNCVTASRSLGRPADLLGDAGQLSTWPRLGRLALPHNTLSALDASFKLATSLKEVDLSHNQLSELTGLEVLPALALLNLSYNRLQSIPLLHRRAGQTLHALALAHNQLETLAGVEILFSLGTLHAGWNCLLEPSSLTPLSRLPHLSQLWLEGNPVNCHVDHRERIVRRLNPHISEAPQFTLNGKPLSEQERRWVGAACLGLPVGPAGSSQRAQPQPPSRETRRTARVREAVIVEIVDPFGPPPFPPQVKSISRKPSKPSKPEIAVPTATGTDHLETQHQVETLREKLGADWLVGMPALLGVQSEAAAESEMGLSSSGQRHEAQAWLDSQERPPPLVLAGSSPCHILVPQFVNGDQTSTTDGEKDEEDDDHVETQSTSSNNMNDITAAFQASDSGTENEQPITDMDDEEGSEPPYIVQREVTSVRGESVLVDYFFIVGPSLMVEREADGRGRVATRWPTESLQSCECPAPREVLLTFDTVRRDKQQRRFLLDPEEAQRLFRSLGARLEARTLRDMNQAEFRCMRCSAHFSAEISGETTSRCPGCGSGIVVQEETTEPHHNLSHSDSRSSIGEPAALLHVAAEIHSCSTELPPTYTHRKKSSAASLEQSLADSGLGLQTRLHRGGEGGDSDIEVLSNPSQSSIEVLPHTDDTHSREQSVAPTERQGSTPSQPKSPHGLTESSSSGSMTDSVCTAYESAQSTCLLSPSGGGGGSAVAVSTPQYSSSLGGVLGSFLQRLAPPSLLAQQPPPSTGQPVQYNYSDFSRVDHRLKLHLCIKVLTHDDEILLALLRCWLLPSASVSGIPYSGLCVVSNQAVYLVKITGHEGDNPEGWLSVEGSWPLSQLSSLRPTAWRHGVRLTLQPSATKSVHYACLLGDARHAGGFLAQASSVLPSSVQLGDAEAPNAEWPLPLLGESKALHLTIASTFFTSQRAGSSRGPLAVAVSETELALSGEDLKWLCDATPSSGVWTERKSITSLVEAETSASAPWLLRLRFLDDQVQAHHGEGAGEGETDSEEWSLWFVSQRARSGVLEALQKPWQNYFEVALDVRMI